MKKKIIKFLRIISIVIIFTFSCEISKIASSAIIDHSNKAKIAQTKELSYEEFLEMNEKYPDNEFNGKIFFNIYGKKVYKDETKLDLSDVKIDDNLDKKLQMLERLTEVDLHNQDLSKARKEELLEEFPNIDFKWTVNVLDEEYENDVTSLDLSKKTIEDIDDLKSSIRLLTKLESIDFSYCNLSNEELGELREEFPDIEIDWVVHLGKWSLRTDSIAFSVLIYRFDYRRMTSKDIEVLKYCTKLQALDLGHQDIVDISVIGEYLKDLRVLILADNKIKDISPIGELKHLHYLELFMNDITDVTPLANCKEMVDLNISFNYHFSDLDGIWEYPLLERLWLVSDRIPESSYTKIKEVYPNVKLVRTGSGSTDSGWRTHERYYKMIDMFHKNYISDVFTKFDDAV